MYPNSHVCPAQGDRSPLDTLLAQMAEAQALVPLSESEFALLCSPRREISVQLRIERDDGSPGLFAGHRVQWNDARGPFKGGIRLHAGESLDSLRALAAVMTLKTALLDLPLGGAKGCIACDPQELSPAELQRLSRAYVRELAGLWGPDRDVPAPDMYTGPAIMGWMMDEFEQIRRQHAPGVITGKPLILGGSPGRLEATAYGGLAVIREVAAHYGPELPGQPIAIHGYGNVGSHTHKLAGTMFGGKVVAVCDSRTGLFHPEGLDYEAVSRFKQTTGSFQDCPLGTALSPDDLLDLDVPLLVLASREGVIHPGNQGQLSAGMVAEMANCPIADTAERSLLDRGILVIPDLLCNAGGVTTSYFEQVQNAQMRRWHEQQVRTRLDDAMTRATQEVMAQAREKKVSSLRLAAHAVAMARVARAMKARGWT